MDENQYSDFGFLIERANAEFSGRTLPFEAPFMPPLTVSSVPHIFVVIQVCGSCEVFGVDKDKEFFEDEDGGL